MKSNAKIDPLYTIFEQHLFNFQDANADRKTFLDAIVKDYISQMRKMGLAVPSEWEEHIFEELFFQVNTMLVKKIYGCLTINEFIETKKKSKDKKVAQAFASQKKKAKVRYQELADQAEQMDLERAQKANDRKSA